jgi:putative methanogenesis marker protein 5
MALFGPLIEEAQAAIIINDSDLAFGCMGCARTNELVKFTVRQRKDIPLLEIKYPSNEEEGLAFVQLIKDFLLSLSPKSDEIRENTE